MRDNWTTCVLCRDLLLIPYRRSFVPRYHAWMADEHLLETTSSERLTLAEEYEAQRGWVDDAGKCTFILFDRAAHEAGAAAPPAYGHSTAGMVGDANLFLLDAGAVADDYFGGVAAGGGAAEVMVMIAEPSARRRGLARRAVEALMWYGASALGLRRFVAKISEDNAPSLALFSQKLGFREARRVAAFKEVHLVRDYSEEEAAGAFSAAACAPSADDEN